MLFIKIYYYLCGEYRALITTGVNVFQLASFCDAQKFPNLPLKRSHRMIQFLYKLQINYAKSLTYHLPLALGLAYPALYPVKLHLLRTNPKNRENNAKSEADLSAATLSGCSTARV